MNTVTVRGEQFAIVSSQRVTGCGPRFDGRMKFTLHRVSDGVEFGWLGGRGARTVPANARLAERGV